MHWHDITLFSGRTMKEVLRDPANLFFGFAFPVLLLWALSVVYHQVGQIPGSVQLGMNDLTPAIAAYAPVFLSLFAGMLLASDRTTTFLTRLFASPMTAADFICGYTLPMLAVCLVQSTLTFAFAILFGFQWSARVVVGIAVILPTALMYTAIGLLCGTLVSDKAVGGICGAMLTTVSFILSGLTIPLTVMGHAFQTIVQTLPFYHAAQMANAAIAGDYGRIWPHMWIVLIYMAVFVAAAILTFTMRVRNR